VLRREPRRGTSADLLVVGLGNPGAEYERTRHNVGAEVVEILARRHGIALKNEKSLSARAGTGTVGGKLVALAVPTTYMNDSGRAVAPLVRRFGVEPAQLVIVQDELDLPPAELKLKDGGGLAGHNGLRSITNHLHTQDYLRVRIGVGKPPDPRRGADHVLKRLGKAEREQMDVTLELAADAVEGIVADGMAATMNRVNTRPKP
jgi:peptidyl-tRNA hydrolase, PTH1 family